MIYKYRSFNDFKYEQVFEEGLVYFSSPREFNDPFECRPEIKMFESITVAKEHLNQRIKAVYPNVSFKKRQEMVHLKLRDYNNKDWQEEYFKGHVERHGIYCMSKVWNQVLMWSHYSHKHMGFCMGFDIGSYDDQLDVAFPVHYSSRYPVLDFNDLYPETDETPIYFTRNLLLTKSARWKYEKEVRFIKVGSLGGSGTVPFERNKITEIILGVNFDQNTEKDRDKLFNLIKEYTPEARIYRASLSNRGYILHRHRVEVG